MFPHISDLEMRWFCENMLRGDSKRPAMMLLINCFDKTRGVKWESGKINIGVDKRSLITCCNTESPHCIDPKHID